MSGAIAQQAEKVIRTLTPPQQEVARHILTRLVRLADEGGEHTRQRIPLAVLYSEDLLNKDAGRRVLSLLTEARLVTVAMASDHRQQMVEIAHEALVRRWPRLGQWLEEDREILVWRQRLGFIIYEWQQTGRDDGFLLRGSLLDEARLWLSRRSNDLTPQKRSSSTQASAFNIGNAPTGQLGASNCWSIARVHSLKSNMCTRSARARQNVWLRIYRFSRVREPGAYRSM